MSGQLPDILFILFIYFVALYILIEDFPAHIVGGKFNQIKGRVKNIDLLISEKLSLSTCTLCLFQSLKSEIYCFDCATNVSLVD